MLGHTHVFIFWDIHPFCFVFKDFADGAPLYTIPRCDVFLARVGIVGMVKADGLAVNIEKALLSLLSTWDDSAWG
jgi:hypothetical protein